MSKERFNWLDIIKLIGMWMIFCDHSHHAWSEQFTYAILQIFFFSSGLFAGKGMQKGFGSFLLNGLRRLMLPYLLFGLASAFLHRQFYDAAGKTLLLELALGCRDHLPCATLWFLPALFCGRLLFYGCWQLSEKFGTSTKVRMIIMGALIALIWAVSCTVRAKMLTVTIAGSNTWCLPWSIDWAGMYMPWYFAGFLLFEKVNSFHFAALSRRGKVLISLITVLAAVYSVWSFIDPEILKIIAKFLNLPFLLSSYFISTILLGLPIFFTALVISKLLNRFDLPAKIGQETLWMCCFEEIFIFILLIIRHFTGFVMPGWTLDPTPSVWTGFLFAVFEILFMYFLMVPVFKKTVGRFL